jgi:hypothetical protein
MMATLGRVENSCICMKERPRYVHEYIGDTILALV